MLITSVLRQAGVDGNSNFSNFVWAIISGDREWEVIPPGAQKPGTVIINSPNFSGGVFFNEGLIRVTPNMFYEKPQKSIFP